MPFERLAFKAFFGVGSKKEKEFPKIKSHEALKASYILSGSRDANNDKLARGTLWLALHALSSVRGQPWSALLPNQTQVHHPSTIVVSDGSTSSLCSLHRCIASLRYKPEIRGLSYLKEVQLYWTCMFSQKSKFLFKV